MKDWLIAHRGSRCDARENTQSAFKATSKYPLGWVELDLHTTKDNIVVCHHDFDISGSQIKHHSYRQLLKLDPELITFNNAIKAINANIPLIVEIKESGAGDKQIAKILGQHPTWKIASYQAYELEKMSKLGLEKSRMFLYQHKHPIGHLRKTIKGGYGGIGYNKYWLWPTSYIRARAHGLQIYTYTVNSPLLALVIRLFYRHAGVCTDRLDLLQKLN